MVWFAAEAFTDNAVPVPVSVMELPLTVKAVVAEASKDRLWRLSDAIFWFVGR
jgi:hypothetical protein